MRPSFAFALAFTLSGCGFTGEPIFAGRRIPDVAPWEDLAPLTICDGTRRIGPLADGPLGVCEASGDGSACTLDADCRSRERCVCGRCAIAVCDTGEECGASSDKLHVCTFGERRCDRTCTTDAGCAAGESCVPGKSVCRGTCSTSDDCQAGETCQTSTGLCIANPCEDDSSCFGGRRCALERIPAALAEPSPLVDGERLTMWLERTDPMGTPAVWRATSRDGLTFTFDPPNAIVDGRAPSVVKSGAGYLMLYGAPSASSVLRASSPDGITFAPDAQPALAAAQSPSLVQLYDGSYAAYFAIPGGPDGPGGPGVGRATSRDGVTFDLQPDVLSPAQVSDPVLWRDVDRISSPFAQALLGVDGKPFVRLWFSAHGTESASSMQFGETLPTPPDFSIGEAAAGDGATFQPYPFNPVFDRVLEFLTHPSELDPAVVPFHDQWLLFYRRAAADGTKSENLAVARSPAQPE